MDLNRIRRGYCCWCTLWASAVLAGSCLTAWAQPSPPALVDPLIWLTLAQTGEGEAMYGEGEPEGEGEAEGEGEGEGVEGEAEGEPGNEPGCTLETVDFVRPRDGATFFLGTALNRFGAETAAETDCTADTAQIAFFLAEPGDPTPRLIGSDDFAPFTAPLEELRRLPKNRSYTLTAEARPRTAGVPPARASREIRLRAASPGLDQNGNGLPDGPFPLLPRFGDRWATAAQLAGGDHRLLVSVVNLGNNTGTKQSGPSTVDVRFTSPVNPGQRLRVTAPRSIVQDDEQALLIAGMAPDPASLIGASEAGLLARLPDGRFDGTAQYVYVSVIISTDGGATFSEVDAGRLSQNPIQIQLTGLPLARNREYVFARHPAIAANLETGPGVLATSGMWRSLDNQTVAAVEGTINGNVTAPGIVAPFEVLDEGTICLDGNCPPPALFTELIVLLAVTILQFVEGGVFSDGPCFIATAAYGTPLAEDLDTLRAFRDTVLLDTAAGTAFVDLYYRLSPGLADLIAQRPALAAVVRVLLVPVVLFAKVLLLLPWPLLALLSGVPLARWARRRAGLS